jgi:hypothetical protein
LIKRSIATSTLGSTIRWTLIPSAVLYAIALGWSSAEGIELQLVVRDLAQTCEAPLGLGFISSVGYLLWMAAAAITLFAAGSGQINGPVAWRQFAYCGGGFSLWLCLDDMFLVHDRYLGEATLYITYVVFSVLLLVCFRKPLRRFGGDSFVLSVLLLGASVCIDALQNYLPFPPTTIQLIEEGFKLLGIAAWLGFWCQYVAGVSRASLVGEPHQ